MDLFDVEYQRFDDEAPLITKKLVFEAIKVCDAIRHCPVDEFKVLKSSIIAPASIYISALRNDKEFKGLIVENDGITYENMLRVFHLTRSDIGNISKDLIKKYYDENFKIIIYNILISSIAANYNCSLNKLSKEYLTYYIHESFIANNLLIQYILDKRYFNAFDSSKLISFELLNKFLGIEFPYVEPDTQETGGDKESKGILIRPDFKHNKSVTQNVLGVDNGNKVLKLKKKNSIPD